MTVEPTKEQMEELEKLDKKYNIYGEYYTIKELEDMGKRIPGGDKSQSIYYDCLRAGKIKEAIGMLIQHNLIK